MPKKKKKQQVVLESCPLNLNGKLKYRINAQLGDQPLHMHYFDIATLIVLIEDAFED
jgi:hypothetical protein